MFTDIKPAVLAATVSSGVTLDAPSGVWQVDGAPPLAYPNDAFAAEQLEGVLRRTEDLSSLSRDLELEGLSWPASYYLSPSRTSLLRPFKWDTTSRVLEVGAGCGTITRFLGETFDEVLALEGEPHRARMARLRTRDQPNVTVLNSPYGDVAFKATFDLVFCIGVLEYASFFSTAQDAFLDMATGLRSRLSPGGTMVLAIENQLGLKYFAGAPEDHTGLPFDGVEGYHRSRGGGATTLSRAGLARLLRAAGFESLDFFFPFPDYKFPACVLGSHAARWTDQESLAALVSHDRATSHAPGGDRLGFDQELVWSEVLSAGLLPDLANSFLVFASVASDAPRRWEAEWDVAGYSLRARRPAYRSSTRLTGLDGPNPLLTRTSLHPGLPAPGAVVTLPYEEPWYALPTLSVKFRAVLQAPDATVAELASELVPWAAFLKEHVDQRGHLDGSHYDATPRNLLVFGDGKCTLLDREMRLVAPCHVHTVVIRGLHQMLVDNSDGVGALLSLRGARYWTVIRALARGLGFDVGARDALRYARFEHELQVLVTGMSRPTKVLLASVLFGRIPIGSPTELVRSRLRRLRYQRSRR